MPSEAMELPAARPWLKRLWQQRTLRVFAVRSLGIAALFAVEVVLARSLGTEGYGTFSFLLAVATLVARIAPLGWLNASTRLISRYELAGEAGLLKGSIILAHAATLLGLALSIAGLAGLVWMSVVPRFGAGAALVVVLTAAIALLELHRYVLRGFHAGDVGESLPILFLPLLVTAGMLALQVSTVPGAAALYTASCLLLLAGSAVLIARRAPAGLWSQAPRYEFRAWSLMALTMMVGGLSDEIATRVPLLVLGGTGSEHEAGLFQAASRLALMSVFILRVITPVAAPRISTLHAEGKLKELRRYFLKLCLAAAAGALPFFVASAVFGEQLLSWFGADFRAAWPAYVVLSAGYLVSAATGPCATGLMMVGRERAYGIAAVANLLIQVALVMVLAPRFGALGAAIGTAIALALINAVYFAMFLAATRTPRAAS